MIGPIVGVHVVINGDIHNDRHAGIIGVLVLIVILVALVGTGVWLSLPPKVISVAQLLPSRPFAHFTVKLDRDDPAIKGIVTALKIKQATKSGFFKRQALKLLIPAALPPSVSVAVASDLGSRAVSLVVYTDLGRLSKVLRLSGSLVAGSLLPGKGPIVRELADGQVVWSRAPGKGQVSFCTYAIIGGTLVLGTSRASILEICALHAGKDAPDTQRDAWGAALVKAMSMRGAYLYADNRGGALSRLVNDATAKYSFAAFPSIDAVSAISGSIVILESAANGKLVFESSSKGQSEVIRSDVQFIYGVAKRIARSAGIRMLGEIETKDGDLAFSFSLPGYMEVLSASGKK